VAVERCGTAAKDASQGIQSSSLQAGSRLENFEDRPWSKVTLNRAVLKRLPRIVHQILVVCRGNPGSEKIRVVCRLADQRKDFACSRIQGNDGAHLIANLFFRGALQIEVD